jgi:hypothetical protein
MSTPAFIPPGHTFTAHAFAFLLGIILYSSIATVGSAYQNKGPVKILVADTKENYTSFFYQKRGIPGEVIGEELMEAIHYALPCSQTTAMSEIRTLIKWDKERQLLSASTENRLEEIGAAFGADYLLTSSFGNLGDEHHWLLSVSLLNVRKGRVSAMATAMGEGRAENVYSDMVKRGVKTIAEHDICPWIGTISVTVKHEKDSTSNTVTNGELSSTTRTETLKDKSEEQWTIAAVAKRYGRTSGEGVVKRTSSFLQQTETKESGNVPCWRNVAPCSIMDDRMPGSFAHNLGYSRSSASGSRQFDGMKIAVAFEGDSAFVSVEGEPMSVGKGTGEEYEMTENTCGKCVSKDEKGEFTGTAWGNWIFGGPAKRSSHHVTGAQKITNEEGVVTEITWDLHQ